MPGALRLVLLSFLVLFVELALIRWTGSNIVYLSFFTNFVLLGSFLGIGIGFLRARAEHNLFPYGVIALAFLIGFVLIAPVKIDRSGSDLIFFGEFTTTGLPTWVTLPVMFLATAGVMALLAEGLARQFIMFEPLEAYRLDIGGSILGIIAFSALSFLGAPPVVWGLVVAACFLVLLPPNIRLIQAVAIVGLVFMLGRESLTPGYTWSPYYRIGLVDHGDGFHEVEVNGIPHQSVLTMAHLESEPHRIYRQTYDRLAVAPSRVLIIGAGNGNDVALALANGADYVDAVEIDPRLQQLGSELHTAQPYQDKRVEVHITDGRAFLEQTDATFDLVLFALPDSLTLLAGQSSVRLESYLFTLEAIEAAREHLGPDGVFSMYNFYREDWLVDRMAGTLETAFDRAPCVDVFGDKIRREAVLTVGNGDASVVCEQPWQRNPDVVSPATDDHPFPYLRERGIPAFYLLTMALILAASAVLIRVVGGPLGPMRRYLDLFFMGSAFLLLETKSVVQFALLFGTTWFVNALVFVGVLASVYVAIEVAMRVRLPNPAVLYGVLVAAVLLAMLVPVEWLLGMPFAPRFAAAVVLWFTPIFIANLVFAQRFRTVADSNVAFGANLLGALLGGVIEYAALVSGYAALAILVALLYGAAFFFGRRLQWGQAA
jgi:SAM-dependent methyltransferase